MATLEPHPSDILPDQAPEAHDPFADAREALDELDHRFVVFARARPLTTFMCALAAGFIVGKLVSRI